MIEGVCGVLTWPGFNSMVTGTGTLVAAFMALYIYSKNRSNQLADLVARRKAVIAALRHQLRATMSHVEWSRNMLRDMKKKKPAEDEGIFWRMATVAFRVSNLDRLRELQSELFAVAGESGDDDVASYLELCADLDMGAKVLDGIIERAQQKGFSAYNEGLINVSVARVQMLLDEMSKLENKAGTLLQGFRDHQGAPATGI